MVEDLRGSYITQALAIEANTMEVQQGSTPPHDSRVSFPVTYELGPKRAEVEEEDTIGAFVCRSIHQ